MPLSISEQKIEILYREQKKWKHWYSIATDVFKIECLYYLSNWDHVLKCVSCDCHNYSLKLDSFSMSTICSRNLHCSTIFSCSIFNWSYSSTRLLYLSKSLSYFSFSSRFWFLNCSLSRSNFFMVYKNAQLSVFESVKLKDKNCISYTINRNCNLAFSWVSFINWDSN